MKQARTKTSLDRVAVLRQTDLFGTLSEPVLQAIAARTITRQLKRREILYSEHEEASGLYIVANGELRSIRQNLEGREQVISTERPGAILAAVAVFNGGKYYSTMVADSDSDVLCIQKRDVHEFCEKHPEVLWNLARMLAHKVRHCADVIETLALRNVDQRVAQHLLTVCRERGVRDGKAWTLELTMSRTEIASRVGSAREVVSRALTHLEKCGLIQTQGRRLVTILDMKALSAFAGSEPALGKARLITEMSSEVA